MTGCGKAKEVSHDQLIRAGESVVTVKDYEAACEITRASYSQQALQQKGVMQEIQIRLMNELIEQALIQERARELKIKITDSVLEKEIAAFKKDYPEDEFRQLLIENAVDYDVWRERFRTRLLIDKVMKKELVERVSVTADEIEKHYKKPAGSGSLRLDIKKVDPENTSTRLVENYRREKVEKKYSDWIGMLQKRYETVINWDLLQRTVGPLNEN